jgi:predicted transcriptional regulator
MNSLQVEWESAKAEEIKQIQINIISAEHRKWEVQKQNEINQLLSGEKNKWLLQQQEQVSLTLSREKANWQR